MTRIIIVDDETLFRRGLIACVNWAENEMTIVGEAINGLDAIQKIRHLKPDVVLLDIKMPVMDGLGVLREIVPEMPDVYFIMLSCMNEYELVRDSMKLGARDYLFKPVVTEVDIVRAIQELPPKEAPVLIPDDTLDFDPAVRKVTELLESRYMEPLTLDDLAAAACLSRNYFCSLFREETGYTPMAYLTSIRIREATRILRDSQARPADVCFQVGFNDYSHFCKTFKRVTGQTPGQVRHR